MWEAVFNTSRKRLINFNCKIFTTYDIRQKNTNKKKSTQKKQLKNSQKSKKGHKKKNKKHVNFRTSTKYQNPNYYSLTTPKKRKTQNPNEKNKNAVVTNHKRVNKHTCTLNITGTELLNLHHKLNITNRIQSTSKKNVKNPTKKIVSALCIHWHTSAWQT